MPRKTMTGTLPEDPEDDYPASAAMVPLSEKEVDAAILASAGEGLSVEIAEGILKGKTIDEILGSTDPTESLVGVIFKPVSWRWSYSTFPTVSKKPGAFVILKVLDIDNRERTVTSGSPNIMAALRAFEKVDVEVPALTVKEHVTSAGFTTFRFHRANVAA